jgi:hypothetical protein
MSALSQCTSPCSTTAPKKLTRSQKRKVKAERQRARALQTARLQPLQLLQSRPEPDSASVHPRDAFQSVLQPRRTSSELDDLMTRSTRMMISSCKFWEGSSDDGQVETADEGIPEEEQETSEEVRLAPSASGGEREWEMVSTEEGVREDDDYVLV